MSDDSVSGDSELPPVPVALCPHCGNAVPVGNFCGVCGGHLAHSDDRLASRRPHAYAAFPDESVLHLSVVTSLFPHLSHRAAVPFRIGLGILVGLLVLFSATGLEVPVIAVAALGVPMLFQLYVYEIDVYEEYRYSLGAITLLLGAALGVGWALVGGPVVANALQPTLGQTLSGARSLEAAVVVPVIGQVLMGVPLLLVLALRPRMDGPRESLDGFVLGAAGALGFTLAAVVANLASQLSAGVTVSSGFTSILTEGLVRGLAAPVTAAAGTGLFGAVLWVRRTEGVPRGGRWRTSPVAALALVLALQIGLGFTDQARFSDVPLVLLHLAAAGLLVLVLRVGLHHIILHEQHAVTVGAPRVCPHCHHRVPTMPFCPTCGVAEVATSKRPRRQVSASEAEPASDELIPGGAPWPVADPEAVVAWSGYPLQSPSLSPREHRTRHVLLLAIFAAGLAIFTVALVLTAFFEAPSSTPRRHCDVFCLGQAFGVGAAHPALAPATIYVDSAGGFSLAGLLSDPSVNPGFYSWSHQTSGPLVNFTLIGGTGKVGGKKVTIGSGEIQFEGMTHVGSETAEAVVDGLVAKNAPNARMAYPLTDPLIGYRPGYGAVYDVQSTSANGSASDTRLVVAASVRNGAAVAVWADGPIDRSFPQSPLLNHPSFVDLDVALVIDPLINSVVWTAPHRP
jgi:hypothetical protein